VPFLDIGGEGEFDRALIYPTHNAPIRIGERLFVFYTGGGAKKDPKKGIPMSIGVATIGLDRFAGLANWRGRTAGKVVTKPLPITRPQLEINLESLEAIPPRVALLAEDGRPLPGYGLDDSTIELSGDRIYSSVRWRDKADLSDLRGGKVKLQFEIKGAVLYSFRFAG
jgi:hypothetical protein